MISPRPQDLNETQLEARARFHEDTAKMFDEKSEPGAARQFRELAAVYAAELARRKAATVKQDE